jgi:hypothetical protein
MVQFKYKIRVKTHWQASFVGFNKLNAAWVQAKTAHRQGEGRVIV